MQSLRRVALRSAVSASRAAAPRVSANSFAAQFAGNNANVTRACAVSIGRFFSQTARVANVNESEDSQPIESALKPSTEEGQDATRSPGRPSRTKEDPNGIFIRNMVFDATEDHLKEIFEKFGTVVKTSISRDARGLSKGFGFVFMESAEAAAQAIAEVNGSFWQGRRIQCSEKTARQPASRTVAEPTKFIYIGNIPYETTDAELNRLFKSLENVADVRVAVDRVTGWPRGFAHADFIDVESAQRAYQKLSGMQLAGRELRCDYTLGPQERPEKKHRKPLEEEYSG